MADEFNPHIGADADAIRKKALQLEAAAEDAVSAFKGAGTAGRKAEQAAIEREAAEKRLLREEAKKPPTTRTTEEATRARAKRLAESYRVESWDNAGRYAILAGSEKGGGAYRVPGTGIYKSQEAAARRMADLQREAGVEVEKQLVAERQTTGATKAKAGAAKKVVVAEEALAARMGEQLALFSPVAPERQQSLFGVNPRGLIPGGPGGPGPGGGGGGGRPPVPPIVPPAGGEPPDRGMNRYAQAAREAETSVRGLSIANQQALATWRASENTLRRHGALTTEFIQAAARGEASFREWGYQIGATAAKFAGWTAVSIPIFAILGGIREIGRGASDSASGVAILGRFLENLDTHAAAEGFRSVSRELNVSVGDVAEAQQSFARVFHNQADSLKAARVALLATKLDNIEAADSFRYFTAIVQEGQVPIERLPGIFDQISAAQRRMGARVAEVLPAIARSYGSIRNVGGDLSQLIALTATTQVATGQTGSSVGTAFYRGAATFFHQNKDVLASYGIDISRGFTQALIDAVRKSRGLSGEQRRTLSQAFFGPQYGGRFAALFSRSDQLETALQVTAPGASRGSAQEELHHQLQAFREEVGKLGNELQRFGSELAQAGFLTFLRTTISGLRTMTSAASEVAHVFGQMSGAAQAVAVGGLGFAGARRLGRRLNLGEDAGPVRTALFGRSDEARARQSVGITMRQIAEQEQADAATFASRAYRASRDADIYTRQYQQEAANLAKTSTFLSAEQLVAADERLEQARLRAVAAEERLSVVLAEQAALDTRIAERRELSSAYQQARRDRDVLGFAQRTGLYVPVGTKLPTDIEQLKHSGAEAPFPIIPGLGPSAPQGEDVGKKTAAARRSFQEAMRQEAQMFRQGITEYGLMSAASASATRLSGEASAAAKAAVAASKGRLEAMAVRFRTMMTAQIGLFNAALIAVIAGEAVIHFFEERQRKSVEDAERINRHVSTAQDRRTRMQENLNRFSRNPVSDKGRAALAAYTADQHTIEVNRRQRARGRPEANLTEGELDQRFKEIANAYDQGWISAGERAKRLDTLLQSLGHTDQVRGNFRTRLQATIARAQTDIPVNQADLIQRLFGAGGIDVLGDDFGKQVDQFATVADSFASGREVMQGFFTRSLGRLTRLAGRHGVKERAEFAGRLDQLVETVTKGAEGQLQSALGAADGQEAINRAYDTYFADIESASKPFRAIRSRSRREVRGFDRQITAVNAQLLASRHDPDSYGDIPKLTQQRDELVTARGEAVKQGRRAARVVGLYNKQIALIEEAMRRQQFQQGEQFRQVQTAVQAHGLAAGTSRAAFLLRAAGAAVTRALQHYKRNSTEVLQAIQGQQEAADALVNEQMAEIQANASLAAARAGNDDRAAARAQAGGIAQQIAFARKHPEVYKPSDITNLIAQQQEAINQANQQRRQREVDIISARYEFLESQTTDEVKIARLELQKASAILHKGGFENQAERFQALAARNKARQALGQTYFQSRSGDIEFLAHTGKISTDVEIAKYRSLESFLKRHHALTKSVRQQIETTIYDLEHQSDSDAGGFNLDVSGLKLPTIFDVRKAFDPVRSQIHHQVRDFHGQMQAASRQMAEPRLTPIEANVVVNVTDKNAAGEVYSAIDRALGTALRARMRSRGMR